MEKTKENPITNQTHHPENEGQLTNESDNVWWADEIIYIYPTLIVFHILIWYGKYYIFTLFCIMIYDDIY